MNIKQKWQSLKTWKKTLIISLLCLTIIGNLIPKREPKAQADAITWSKMSKEQQTEWILNIKDNMPAGKISVALEDAILKQIKYTLEADVYILDALLNPQHIGKAEGEPVYMFVGKATSKNGFGVKVGMNWIAQVTIKPEEITINSVQVY